MTMNMHMHQEDKTQATEQSLDPNHMQVTTKPHFFKTTHKPN